ncbi:hypothetical protein TNCV_1181461 [Trichonephila clavipes]|nr:hypothetical protein TNCV_1181461 [Trichonephila clavipes]
MLHSHNVGRKPKEVTYPCPERYVYKSCDGSISDHSTHPLGYEFALFTTNPSQINWIVAGSSSLHPTSLGAQERGDNILQSHVAVAVKPVTKATVT